MHEVNKPYLYKLLEQIKLSENIDVSEYISMIVGSSSIPYEVVVFINKHIPISQLTTYNAIYSKRNKSRLFRNIVKDSLSIEDKSIVLSSILNQSLISLKQDKSVDREDLINAVNVDLIMSALSSYLYDNNDKEVEDCFEMFRIIFKTLFPR